MKDEYSNLSNLCIHVLVHSLTDNNKNEQSITNWVNPNDKTGEFKRGQSAFRSFISKNPGSEFPPEKGRYHLYVSYACPWG